MTEEQEMIALRIEAIYREYYATFGPVPVPRVESVELAGLWARWEQLDRGAA